MEHLNDLKEQCFGASKYQRNLLDMWWKPWKQQGFASPLPYSHLKNDRRHANIETYRLCQVLRSKIPVSGQTRTVKVGYEEGHSLAGRKNEPTPQKEIVVSV